MSFRSNFKITFLIITIVSSILSTPAFSAPQKSKIPSGYVKWKDGSQFAYKWITKIPKDIYYQGTWQGVSSIISVIYLNGFSCAPELPDGTTNSIEVEMKILRYGNKGFTGQGFANTVDTKGAFKIELTFYGAPKGYGQSVKKVEITTIECRM